MSYAARTRRSAYSCDATGDYQLRLVFYEQEAAPRSSCSRPKESTTFRGQGLSSGGRCSRGGTAVTGFGGAIRPMCRPPCEMNHRSGRHRVSRRSGGDLRLLLRMQYNDGFVASSAPEIAAQRAGAAQLALVGPCSRSVAQSNTVEEFNVSEFVSALRAGKNVLAIQGMSRLTSDVDFLMLPELVGATDSLQFRYFVTATPGQPNSSGVLDFVADTKFSVDHGFYEAPIEVAITTATPGATIRYTLNGSEPTANSGILYTGPITIGQTTVLRAEAFLNDWHRAASTQTYLFLADVVRQNRQTALDRRQPCGWGPQLEKPSGRLALCRSSPMSTLFDRTTGIYVNAGRPQLGANC